jgi:hypothetical protein
LGGTAWKIDTLAPSRVRVFILQRSCPKITSGFSTGD